MAADDRTLTADSASILAAATEPSVEVAPSGELAIGTHLGRYEVVERIGAGGMGVVYRARDPALGRDLAIKVVPSTGGGEAQARLLREAQAMAQLRRPGVVPVFDVGTIGAGVFVVMPYLSGGTLGGWLAAAPRPWREVLDRFVAAGRGLAVAHAAGLVHRDFKPDNVLVDERGEVAVADFGLARAAHASDPDARGARGASSPDITRVGAIVGTPAYMAPEQLRGEPFDARADIFGFCISLYQGLYGERPFAMSTGRGGFAVADLLDAIVAQRVRPPGADRRVPVWLRSAVVRGLAADPRDRWPSVDALLAHIDARRRRPRRIAIAIAIAVALAAAAAGIALVTRAAPPPSPPVAYHEQRISSRGDVGAAALSPDGHHVIAIAGSDLLLFDLDRRDPPRTLATDANPVSSNMTAPTWSPDGHELLYQCYAGSPSKVWCAASLDGPAHAPPMQYQGLTLARDGAVVVSAQPMRGFSVVGADGIVRSACQIPGDYTFVERVVVSPTTDDVFVVVSTGLLADRIYHADLGCTHVEPIVTDVPLLSFAPSADGTGLVAMRLQGERAEAISIDRGGEIRSLGAPSFDPTAMIAGARTDGSLVVVDGEYAWRLLRVDRAGHTAEIAAASGRADLALSPDRTRLAVIELAYDGGVLRVGQLARPQELGPAIADHALEADWSPDGRRLATITHDGGAMHLVVLDPDGGHRDVRPLDDASPDGELTWIGPDQIAYQLHGNVGYAVIDLATGARHDLFDRTLGWAFELIRAPSGALAWEWNRMPANSIWMTPPAGGAPRFVSFAPGGARPVWTPDGDLLTAADRSPTIVHVDPATGRTEPYVTLPVEHGVTNGRLFALDGGDLLVQRSSSVTDVELVTPER